MIWLEEKNKLFYVKLYLTNNKNNNDKQNFISQIIT